MKKQLPGQENDMTYASFNQDCTRICVGLRHGYRTFSLDPFRMVNEKSVDGGASIFEVLFSSSLAAHVPAGEGASSSQRVVRIFNIRRNKEITRMSYSSSVLACKMNRKTLVVVIETAIYIYDITNMHLLHTISGTPPNPQGICALASCHVPGDAASSANNFFAYPGDLATGQVYVYDVSNMRHVTTMSAHTGLISCLAFSHAGDRLATASQKGTVFRVFSCPDGQKLFELRRGWKTYANISSLSFNFDASFLCATSDKATVHVFKLDQAASVAAQTSAAPAPPPASSLTPASAAGSAATTSSSTVPSAAGSAGGSGAAAAGSEAGAQSSWSSYLLSTATYAASLLPTAVTDVFTQSRSFAQITLPSEGLQVMASLIGNAENTSVAVITSQGYLLKYRMDMEKGGDCAETARHSLLASYQSNEGSEGAAASEAFD